MSWKNRAKLRIAYQLPPVRWFWCRFLWQLVIWVSGKFVFNVIVDRDLYWEDTFSSHRNANEIKIHLINAIVHLLKCVRVTKEISFKTIVIAMLSEISTQDTMKIKPNLSEEYKLAVISCIEATSRYANSTVIEQFYVPANSGMIARTFLLCVDIIGTETYRALRYAFFSISVKVRIDDVLIFSV